MQPTTMSIDSDITLTFMQQQQLQQYKMIADQAQQAVRNVLVKMKHLQEKYEQKLQT